MPLDPDFRTVLKGESRPPKRPKPPRPVCDDPFVAMWMKIIDAAGELAAAHDRKWMRRRRVLNSLIVMVEGRQGLRHRDRGVVGPVPEAGDRRSASRWPPRRSARPGPGCTRTCSLTCAGKSSVTAETAADGEPYLRHRRNQDEPPRPLVEAGYPLPNANTHYPQGLVSCLYRLDTKTPVDFSLSANAASGPQRSPISMPCRRAMLVNSTAATSRSCFCTPCVSRGLQSSATARPPSPASSTAARTTPSSATALCDLRAAFPGKPLDPVELRLVKYKAGQDEYTLATTLVDRDRYTRDDLSSLYHGRWGIGNSTDFQDHDRGGRVSAGPGGAFARNSTPTSPAP